MIGRALGYSLLVASMLGGIATAQSLPVLPAQARPAPPPADDDDPVEKCAAIQQMPRQVACLKNVLAEAEKALDALLKKADGQVARHPRLPPPEKEKWRATFAEAQATWRKFIELDCDGAVAREAFGDPAAEAATIACRASLVRARVSDLETRFGE